MLLVIDAPNMALRGASTNCPMRTMLERLLREQRPEAAVAAWDDREASVRREMYPPYKANRKRRDDVPEILRAAARDVRDAGVESIYGVLGAEADDLMATIAAKTLAELDVYLASSDKDLYQCLDERTLLVTRRRGVTDIVTMAGFLAEYAVMPHAWPDVMALAGAKNGIPGLPGIGFKGALELIREFGDLEELLTRRAEVKKPSYRAALEAEDAGAQARLFRTLLQLRSDLPIEVDPDKWRIGR